MSRDYILKGTICHSSDQKQIEIVEGGCLICVDGISQGIYREIPEKYEHLPLVDYGDKLIIPGMTDLHVHAPQYAFRGLGMDMELLEWLNTHTFLEERKYENLEYARPAYEIFVDALRKGPTTRAAIFATMHVEATELLMDMLEDSGLNTLVGKVNMDRNAPDYLCEPSPQEALVNTRKWLEDIQGRYTRTAPILTPRFIPTCSDELMEGIRDIQKQYQLPVQSHLSENRSEIDWVRELCPWSVSYGDAYDHFGLFGKTVPTVMAHCVHSAESEVALMKQNGVFIAHCPQSNTNLASGIAPIRRYLDEDMKVGLGTDVAGGASLSMFRCLTDAIAVSKLRWRLLDSDLKPLSFEEAFYLATVGGGAFFGKVGAFEAGYEVDALVLSDEKLSHPQPLDARDRLERLFYLWEEGGEILSKYVAGEMIL